jgi:hypothetical protein
LVLYLENLCLTEKSRIFNPKPRQAPERCRKYQYKKYQKYKMKKILFLILSITIYSCSNDKNSNDEVEKPQINLTTSIISPLKNRDYSFHNNGVNGVFEDPTTQKKLKGKIVLSNDSNTSNTNLIVKWKSDIDGQLFEGTPNSNFESEININLSKGFHKILFEVYTNNNVLIKKDSITISNVIKLEATNDTGKSVKLNWTKYEGNNFLSYLIYGENLQPLMEIHDINTLNYEYVETKSLIEKRNYQIVVKTNNSINQVLGSNIISKISGNFIEFPYYVPKIIKDNARSKIYAIVAPKYSTDTADKYGILILNSASLAIESHILVNNRYTDLDISPDGQYLFLTQRTEEKLTKIDLNTMVVTSFTTSTNNWGFHKIEVGNNNVLFCHRSPPTSGSTGIHMINGLTGNEINISYYGYSHGDIEYNSQNGKLYHSESNTSSGTISSNTYLNQYLNIENKYPVFPNDVTYPEPFLIISDDNNSIFWENYQLSNNLQVTRQFNTKIIACSPNNLYISNLDKIYDYNNLSVVFNYPPFPINDSNKSILFIDDNTIITSKPYKSSTSNDPGKTYFFKMKIN